jgi:hypothetical protein
MGVVKASSRTLSADSGRVSGDPMLKRLPVDPVLII